MSHACPQTRPTLDPCPISSCYIPSNHARNHMILKSIMLAPYKPQADMHMHPVEILGPEEL